MSGAANPIPEREQQARLSFPAGCGPACPNRDWVSGICDRHGPTEIDRIVERVTEAFRRDVHRIMGGRNGR